MNHPQMEVDTGEAVSDASSDEIIGGRAPANTLPRRGVADYNERALSRLLSDAIAEESPSPSLAKETSSEEDDSVSSDGESLDSSSSNRLKGSSSKRRGAPGRASSAMTSLVRRLTADRCLRVGWHGCDTKLCAFPARTSPPPTPITAEILRQLAAIRDGKCPAHDKSGNPCPRPDCKGKAHSYIRYALLRDQAARADSDASQPEVADPPPRPQPYYPDAEPDRFPRGDRQRDCPPRPPARARSTRSSTKRSVRDSPRRPRTQE